MTQGRKSKERIELESRASYRENKKDTTEEFRQYTYHISGTVMLEGVRRHKMTRDLALTIIAHNEDEARLMSKNATLYIKSVELVGEITDGSSGL